MEQNPRKRLTPYQRIVRAAKEGVGIRLSEDECYTLAMDDAIRTVAASDDGEEDIRPPVREYGDTPD